MGTRLSTDPFAAGLALPRGTGLPNRVAKAAMMEGVGDADWRVTDRPARRYRRSSEGGAGLLMSAPGAGLRQARPPWGSRKRGPARRFLERGNVQIDRFVLERPGDVVLDSR